MAYLGNDLQVAFPVYRNIDDISGSFNSSTTSFPLRVSGVAPVPAPLYSQQCLISVGGVVQRPDDSGSEGFRLSGGNIIFASAPTTGADFFGVILAGADYINAGGNFPSGTAAVPSITFNDDLDTGIYNSGINQVSITTGGSERLRIDSAGQIESVSLGTAAAPAFSFTTDPNTGIYSPGADQVAISTGGSGRLFVDESGRVGVGTSTPQHLLDCVSIGRFTGNTNSAASGAGIEIGYDSGNTTGFIQSYNRGSSTYLSTAVDGSDVRFKTSSTERARIDSSGRLLVGTSSARSNFYNSTLTSLFQVENASGTRLTSFTYGEVGNSGPIHVFAKHRSASVGGVTIVAADDNLGTLSFQGSDGTEFVAGAEITAQVDGTPGANDMPGRLVFSTTADGASSPTERMRIDSSGRVGVGTTSPGQALSVAGNISSSAVGTNYVASSSQGVTTSYLITDTSGGNIQVDGAWPIRFTTNSNERARIDSSGRLLVGTSSAVSGVAGFSAPYIQAVGTFDQGSILSRNTSNDNTNCGIIFQKIRGSSAVQSEDYLGEIRFNGYDGTADRGAAQIFAQVDGTPGTGDMPGRLVFSTTADGASSPTERLRITQAGHVFVGNVTGDYNTVGISLFSNGNLQAVTNQIPTLVLNRKGSDGVIVDFYRDTNNPGTISVTTTATSYNTSSDYRLKENVTPVTDGITRLQQLKPSRFNFIAAPGCTVDGFIAHEVQSVVPEAITGEKDAVDADGKPQYQGIDQSKLVPLLTAALQEAVAKIESLESRLTAAGI